MKPLSQKLLELLSDRDVTFFIPPYQRNYEWEKEQCEIFWNDIVQTVAENLEGRKAEHFFGTVTYFKDEDTVFGEPDKLILIDGQQRITTTMLFLVALRDVIKSDELKELIDSRYLKNERSTDESEYKIKLKQVETDWSAYRKIILQEDMNSREKDSYVYKNYLLFKTWINKYAKEHNSDGVAELIQLGLNCFSVITVQLEPAQNKWENPQEIFESMNSIGKPLSLADLVRNYLLMGHDSFKQEYYYKNYWLKIEETIPGQISNFIRDYMQVVLCEPCKKASETNYKELYSQFKNVFFINGDPEGLLTRLVEYSSYYACLCCGSTTCDESIDGQLNDILALGATTSISFVMELICKWKREEITNQELLSILNVFKIYLYRRRILGLTAQENLQFPKLISYIDEICESLDKPSYLLHIISNLDFSMRIPNNDEIANYLETYNFYSFKYCGIFLKLIEETLTKSRPRDGLIQIEHIMPQTLNHRWEQDLGNNYEEIHQKYVNQIGNLTLIRHNQELGNKPFVEKKEIYENHAGLQIAKSMITNNRVWTENEIKKRSDWIINILLNDVLPIPDNMRHANNYALKERRGLSFEALDLIGETISFIEDPSYTAVVVSDNMVEFEGKKWRMSPLTRELYTRKGMCNKSGAYEGANHWQYDGVKLKDYYA